MTGFDVDPEALLAHGAGSERLADKFEELGALLDRARVDDQCFGPIGDALHLSGGYHSALEECEALATQAAGFLRTGAEMTRESAATYLGVDDGLARALESIGDTLRGGGR
ncbi:hypothetical protein C1701_09540 [Actinoalloteichus sp. AHMU CJ021]|uniref:ESX-1 secretion-associated protein n=1 Tax=Actinoalloteichus caeruleus DSM 43889 TaxID=1120930 RepID=A0ABT1JJL1_ACTCY|nr:hypothetical protein [Actinoalloteichus caeruleus]AUS78572.1 hypothetical protein C1701_09540 [Actinoalloteichus sp. AHMU CJ021]MCP2332695.1 Protein of unknown function (DUF2580) [Actinoalloteichus caeruleus DSM 43889]